MRSHRKKGPKARVRKIHKGVCYGLGIAAGMVEMCLWSYYGGLAVPLGYEVGAEMASTALAPALQGFSITAGGLGCVSIAAGIWAAVNQNIGVGIAAGSGLCLALLFMSTAIALAQYESLLVDQLMDKTIACVETACLALGGIIMISELASLAAGKC